MRVIFWFLIVLWLVSIAGRLALTFSTFEYHSDLIRAYWGTRFFGAHILVEAVILTMLGSAVHTHIHSPLPSWASKGFWIFFAFVTVHFVTLNYEIGYKEQATIANQKHVVNWTYSPSVHREFRDINSLKIDAIFPGYLPWHTDERPPRYLRLRITKADSPQAINSSVFQRASFYPDEAECVSKRPNRYCRFTHNKAWYVIHHQTFGRKMFQPFPSLEEFQIEIPKLFDTFLTE